jgi:hypothetical protein
MERGGAMGAAAFLLACACLLRLAPGAPARATNRHQCEMPPYGTENTPDRCS